MPSYSMHARAAFALRLLAVVRIEFASRFASDLSLEACTPSGLPILGP